MRHPGSIVHTTRNHYPWGPTHRALSDDEVCVSVGAEVRVGWVRAEKLRHEIIFSAFLANAAKPRRQQRESITCGTRVMLAEKLPWEFSTDYEWQNSGPDHLFENAKQHVRSRPERFQLMGSARSRQHRCRRTAHVRVIRRTGAISSPWYRPRYKYNVLGSITGVFGRRCRFLVLIRT